ncbi:uncharacterized protein LOC144654760 [Oculina patagonica]
MEVDPQPEETSWPGNKLVEDMEVDPHVTYGALEQRPTVPGINALGSHWNTTLNALQQQQQPSSVQVSPCPAARIKPKPINNHTMNKSKLFKGLDEDLSPSTFKPRKSIKRLVIKPKSDK